MQTVCLKPLYHRQDEHIGIYYLNNNALNAIVRKLKGVKWSQTNKCWYLPLSEDAYKAINDALKSMAEIDSSLLKQYLQKKKQVAKTLVSPSGASVVSKAINSSPASPAWKLNKENLEALQRFVEQLKLKAYSISTIKTYATNFCSFCKS